MLAQMINRPCTILRRSGTGEQDELGDETKETVEIPTVCELQQSTGSSYRSEDEDEVSDTRWTLYLLADEEIGSGDAVVVEGGGEFEVYGEPWRVWNPRTRSYSHIEVGVRRTAGWGESS